MNLNQTIVGIKKIAFLMLLPENQSLTEDSQSFFVLSENFITFYRLFLL